MKQKANELNIIFNTDKWMPRYIDKILWSVRNDEVHNFSLNKCIHDFEVPKDYNKELFNDVIENLNIISRTI